jgi:hypothetical protein
MLTKINLFILAVAFCWTSKLPGQDIDKKYPDLIKLVRIINKDTALKKVILTNEQFLKHPYDGGGTLTGYFKNDQIQKITREIGLSNGVEVYDYYFKNGKLCFIYELFHGFMWNEKKQKFDFDKTEVNFIGRYYFKDDRLIDNETTGHNRFEGDNLDMEKTLVKETKDNLTALRNHLR